MSLCERRFLASALAFRFSRDREGGMVALRDNKFFPEWEKMSRKDAKPAKNQ
jgi:hypothetical protein